MINGSKPRSPELQRTASTGNVGANGRSLTPGKERLERRRSAVGMGIGMGMGMGMGAGSASSASPEEGKEVWSRSQWVDAATR